MCRAGVKGLDDLHYVGGDETAKITNHYTGWQYNKQSRYIVPLIIPLIPKVQGMYQPFEFLLLALLNKVSRFHWIY